MDIVLVVMQNPALRSLLAESLLDYSREMNVFDVSSREEALEFMDARRIRLLVADSEISGLGLAGLLDWVAQNRPSVECLVMSEEALDKNKLPVAGHLLHFLQKPFELDELGKKILTILKGQAAAIEPVIAENSSAGKKAADDAAKQPDFLIHERIKETALNVEPVPGLEDRLAPHLEKLKTLEGYKSFVLVNFAGEVLACDSSDETARLIQAAYGLNNVLRLSCRAGQKAGLGAIAHTELTGSLGRVVMAVADEKSPLLIHGLALMDSGGDTQKLKTYLAAMLLDAAGQLAEKQ
jgi:DNA-binding response OmpR family regulator